MRYLLGGLRLFAYTILLILFTAIALRFTLDLNRLRPDIERVMSEKSGGDFKISSLDFAGALGLSVPSAELTFPLTPEQELEWESFRSYLKERREAKSEGRPEPEAIKAPSPAMKLCVQNLNVDLPLSALMSVALGGELSADLETKIFECGESEIPLAESEVRRLSVHVSTLWDGPSAPKRAQDFSVRFKLNELELSEIDFLAHSSPVKLSGALVAEGEGVINIGRLGRLQLKKSTGILNLEVSGLKTKAATIDALELPAVTLGEVKAKLNFDRGELRLSEFQTRSDDLKGDLTGNIKVLGGWLRSKLELHVALDLSSEFMIKNPDVKTIATLQRRYFTRRGDGGYDVGILFKGSVNRPRVTAARNSPYSKEGRELNRNQKKRDRAKSRVSNRPNARPNNRSKAPSNNSLEEKRNRRAKAKKERRKNRIKNRVEPTLPLNPLEKEALVEEPQEAESDEEAEDGRAGAEGEAESEGEGELEGEVEGEGETEGEAEAEGVEEEE